MKISDFSFRRFRSSSIAVKLTVLATYAVLLLLILSPVAFATAGTEGFIAAGLAAVACFTGAGISMWITDYLGKTGAALASLLLGAIVRICTPFAVFWAVWMLAPQYIDAGFVFYLPGFYLVTLWVETLLSLPVANRDRMEQK